MLPPGRYGTMYGSGCSNDLSLSSPFCIALSICIGSSKSLYTSNSALIFSAYETGVCRESASGVCYVSLGHTST